jgi:hypothetical protein
VSQPALELRIYTGLHSGAKAAFTAPDQIVNLGSDPANDVILRDASFATAQITLLQEGWRWVQAEVDQTIPWASCVRIADLVLGVDYQYAEWPSPDNLQIALQQGAAISPAALVDEVNTPQTEPEQAGAEPIMRIAPDEAPAFLNKVAKPHGSFLKLAIAASVLALGAALLVLGLQTDGKPEVAIAQAKALQPNNTAQLTALKQAVAAAGYAKLVRVQAQAEGKFQLIGVVGNEAQLDDLLRAASTVTRRISPNVLTQSEFSARLKTLAPQLPQGVEAQALAIGVVGFKANAALAASLLQAKELIRRELPEMVVFELAAADAEPVAQRALGASQSQLLKTSLLPKVAAIQSGPHSYVLLLNGRKIMPGGSLENHKLLQIEDNALVLEDKSGQTVRVSR